MGWDITAVSCKYVTHSHFLYILPVRSCHAPPHQKIQNYYCSLRQPLISKSIHHTDVSIAFSSSYNRHVAIQNLSKENSI